MIRVVSNTNAARYLIDGNPKVRYVTSGNAGSAASIFISFTAATILTHILIQRHNLDEFYIYYNNTTSNCLLFECSNSSENLFLSFASTTVSSIQIALGRTIGWPTVDEKRVGELLLLERTTTLDRYPSMPNFEYGLDMKQVVQEMPDGGINVYQIRENFFAKIKWRFIDETFKNTLKTLYEDALPFTFIPAGTTTSWDGKAYEVEWLGNFDFKAATNKEAIGWNGNMILKQISKQR